MNKRGLLVLALMVLLALGGALLAAACGGSEDGNASGQTEPSVTVTITPESTAALPTPTALPPTQPPPTEPAPTDVPPAPTPDTRVAIMDRPTLDQIQLGKDGKYFIADRGDGCIWVEHSRTVSPDFGEEIVLVTDCPIDFAFVYRIGTGEIFPLAP